MKLVSVSLSLSVFVLILVLDLEVIGIRGEDPDLQHRQEEDSDSSRLCLACRREEARARSIRAIKDGILRRLGFEGPVNVTGKRLPAVPRHLLLKWEEDYRQFQGDQGAGAGAGGDGSPDEEDDFHVRTERIVTFARSHPRIRHFKGHNVLHFNLSASVTKFRVANASLYVYVAGTEASPATKASSAAPPARQPVVTVEVFKLREPDVASAQRAAARRVERPRGAGGWVRVDATVALSEWFKSPHENYGFFVDATAADGRRVPLEIDKSENTPYAEIHTSEPKRRIRRQNLNCEERSPESVCCRYPLQVDFETFGWDFIIAPKRYDAHYCSGECSYLTLQKHPHTHLATMAAPQVATPCCAPRKLSPITMLYFDDNSNVVYGSLPGMVVDRCGCS